MIEDDLRDFAVECTNLAESSLKAIKDLKIRKRAWSTMEQAAADMRERAAIAVHDLMPSWFRDGTIGRAEIERVIRRLPLYDARTIARATRNTPDPALQTTLRPREYLGSEEYPEGIYSGHDLRLADMTPNAAVGSPCGVMSIIWSVGATPEDAIRGKGHRANCAEVLKALYLTDCRVWTEAGFATTRSNRERVERNERMVPHAWDRFMRTEGEDLVLLADPGDTELCDYDVETLIEVWYFLHPPQEKSCP